MDVNTITLPTPGDIEQAAAAAGISVAAACRLAGIPRSTFARWKNGQSDPSLGTVQRLADAIAKAATDPALRQPSAA